jgi:hypothetical protein
MAITPGAWHYDGRRWIRDERGIGVLRVQLGASPDDARCAAAAPALLAALRLAEAYMATLDQGLRAPVLPERLATIRAAIAAAEPQQEQESAA